MNPRSIAYNELLNSADRLAKRLSYQTAPAPYRDAVTGELVTPPAPPPRQCFTPQFIPELGGFQFHDPEQGWTITVIVDIASLARAEEDPHQPIAYNAAGFIHEPDMDAYVDRTFTTTDLSAHENVVAAWIRLLSQRSHDPEPKIYIGDDAIQYQANKPDMEYDGPLFLNMAE